MPSNGANASFAAGWMEAMRRGDYPAAWDIDAAIRAGRDPATRDDPRLPYHLRWVWDGRAFDGRDVLVRCYHGLGDTLQFLRYLPALRQRTASVTLEVQPEIVPLLRGMPGIYRVRPFDVAHPTPPAACDLEIMELASALRIEPAGLPPPYLRVAPAPRREEPVVGLCWQAGGWDADRSAPSGLLAAMTRRPCVTLCPGPTGHAVLNPAGCPDTLEGTAALVASLALVITVDTMIAHLAGALNVPTLLLLKHEADWRWGDGCETPWYPATRLYRQETPGDWGPAIAQATADLRASGL